MMKNQQLMMAISFAILVKAPLQAEEWKTKTQEEWSSNSASSPQLEIKDGMLRATADRAVYKSVLKSFDSKRSPKSIIVHQSTAWLNWQAVKDMKPKGAGGAPIFMKKAAGDYWLLSIVNRSLPKAKKGAAPVKLAGFDTPLLPTTDPNQFLAKGGEKLGQGGYRAWQSKDMKNWVYHGSVTTRKGAWATSAEFVDGKAYIYHDYPNDQDPHLTIDEDLTDGLPGKEMGKVFADPSHGSDSAVIRDLEGKFHIIYEDWSPIDASVRAWDSPLAGHTVSEDGINDFEILAPAVDERTTPTGEIGTYFHPHWHKTDPENYPGVVVPEDIPQHRIKKGGVFSQAKYEIHSPAQRAYGDWSAISIGGQYYLFADYDPVGAKSKSEMSVAWFTSSSIDEQFTLCGNIGSGHPDPDIMFAEGQFYLVTQNQLDYISPGPWVDGVEVRVGVDTDNDKAVDQWTEWSVVKESYDHIEGFSKQVSKTPAQADLSELPEGFGFQYEIRLTDKTSNDVKPVIDQVTLQF